MKLEYNVEVPAKKGKAEISSLEALTEFSKSDSQTALIHWEEDYRNIPSCVTVLRRLSRQNNFDLVVVSRKDKVYLVKNQQ